MGWVGVRVYVRERERGERERVGRERECDRERAGREGNNAVRAALAWGGCEGGGGDTFVVVAGAGDVSARSGGVAVVDDVS